ncbi:sulfotransferase family 2 domain-containing protein [Henriciella pelagia]|uniref:sulfotransferase family 2 domain-containing protein n=1 Tax=Henriciella pelagia TaxID=1977912 RepID=UPI0035179D52
MLFNRPASPTLSAGAPVIVFLHIPKTAGQSVHAGLTQAVGAAQVSPVRVHSQAGPGAEQLPSGYKLYSGHIDWDALEVLPTNRFVFSVLRDPLERIASFYFYLLNEAKALSPKELTKPERTGMRRILETDAEGYFFSGDHMWQSFIRDHYDNTYCAYFATRKLRGGGEISNCTEAEILDRAEAGARSLNAIYTVAELKALEDDLAPLLGRRPRIADRKVNAGPGGAAARWPKLRSLIRNPENLARLEGFAERDRTLMVRLGLSDPSQEQI